MLRKRNGLPLITIVKNKKTILNLNTIVIFKKDALHFEVGVEVPRESGGKGLLLVRS